MRLLDLETAMQRVSITRDSLLMKLSTFCGAPVIDLVLSALYRRYLLRRVRYFYLYFRVDEAASGRETNYDKFSFIELSEWHKRVQRRMRILERVMHCYLRSYNIKI